VSTLANVDDFMGTGRLGEIGIGSTPDDVVRCIGEPDNISVVRVPAAIWLFGAPFGDVQIHCTRAAVEMIVVRLGATQVSTHAPKIRFEGWLPPVDLAFEAFTEHLDLIGLIWQVDPLLTWTSQKTVSICASTVSAVFVDDQLQMLGLAGPLFQPAPGPKQRKRAGS